MKIFAIFILILITIYSGVYSRTSNPELNKSLVAAARTGNLSRVKQLVNDGADINAVTEGFLPLVEAINNKHTQTAEYIITKGALVNLQDKDGDTALIVAALRGNMEILLLLKKQGADFNIQNKTGKTALMYGVYGKHSEIVRYLLENGANPILRDKSGLDAFMLAITIKKRDIIEPLLEYGAPVTMEHLKLAHKLYCVPDNRFNLKGFKNNYSNVSAPFEKIYQIKKDVDYKPYYKLVKTILSYDKTRKMEAYDNGVIKIYEANTNRFITGFGNILFIKKVQFPLPHKIFIEMISTFDVAYFPQINPTEPFIPAPLLQLNGSMVTVIIDIEKNQFFYSYLSDGFRGMEVLRLSKSGKYFLIIRRSTINPGGSITLHETANGKKLYVFNSANYSSLEGLFWDLEKPSFSGLSDDEKLFWINFFSYKY